MFDITRVSGLASFHFVQRRRTFCIWPCRDLGGGVLGPRRWRHMKKSLPGTVGTEARHNASNASSQYALLFQPLPLVVLRFVVDIGVDIVQQHETYRRCRMDKIRRQPRSRQSASSCSTVSVGDLFVVTESNKMAKIYCAVKTHENCSVWSEVCTAKGFLKITKRAQWVKWHSRVTVVSCSVAACVTAYTFLSTVIIDTDHTPSNITRPYVYV